MNNTKNAVNCHHVEHEPEECPIVSDIILQPGEGRRLPLGIYEKDLKHPPFEVVCANQDIDSVTSTLQKIEASDEYTLMYFVQNFSEQTQRVIVREVVAD